MSYRIEFPFSPELRKWHRREFLAAPCLLMTLLALYTLMGVVSLGPIPTDTPLFERLALTAAGLGLVGFPGILVWTTVNLDRLEAKYLPTLSIDTLETLMAAAHSYGGPGEFRIDSVVREYKRRRAVELPSLNLGSPPTSA